MFPTHDMNPIAIDHMQRERLAADTAFVDKQAAAVKSGLVGRMLGCIIRYMRSIGLRSPTK